MERQSFFFSFYQSTLLSQEMNTSEHRSEFYGGGKQPEADMPFHFLSVDLDSKLTNLIPYDKGKTILKLPPNERANKLKMKNFIVAIVGSPVL